MEMMNRVNFEWFPRLRLASAKIVRGHDLLSRVLCSNVAAIAAVCQRTRLNVECGDFGASACEVARGRVALAWIPASISCRRSLFRPQYGHVFLEKLHLEEVLSRGVFWNKLAENRAIFWVPWGWARVASWGADLKKGPPPMPLDG